jgi:uncharacterized protein YdhG (YjbR/CyaY superfamily)
MTDAKLSKRATKEHDDEAEVITAIAAMTKQDRVIGERLHAITKASAPALLPRTWYGMPAYTNGNKIVCFFRSRQKFGERYMTLGFNDVAKLDDGHMWPVNFALTELTATEESRIVALVKKSVSEEHSVTY